MNICIYYVCDHYRTRIMLIITFVSDPVNVSYTLQRVEGEKESEMY